MITGKSNIGYVESSVTEETFRTFNPLLNRENDHVFYEPNAEEISETCDKAWKAFRKYRKVSDEKKSLFLLEIVVEIDAMAAELIEVYCSESGLPQERALAELERTKKQIVNFAELLRSGNFGTDRLDEAIPDRLPHPKPKLVKKTIAIGPVVVFGASNFPFAYSTIGGDSVSALAAGCSVIVKSHPMHAGTSEMMTQAILKAAKKNDLPDGIFSNLNSKGINVGQLLVQHTRVKAVGFTGSIKGGRAIMDLASKRLDPIPVFAEMGSQNPVVFFENALEDEAEHWSSIYAEAIMNSAGQFCTNPGLLIAVKSPHFSRFIHLLGEKVAKIEAKCMLHPNIWKNYTTLKDVANSLSSVEIVTKDTATQPNFASGNIVKVSGKNFINETHLKQEVFGPFSVCVECETEEEIFEILDSLDGQLTGTLVAGENPNRDVLQHYVNELELKVGRIILNGVPIGGEVCPAMHHGGPYPAASDARFTALGDDSMLRWLRPVSYQNF